VILALQPVKFRYKPEIDPQGVPQFGLVAEDVAKVDPDLVARDAQGRVFSVRYEAVNAMLLNEFLKQHRQVQEQDRLISEQQKQIQALTRQMAALATKIQQASDQIEHMKAAPSPMASLLP
jgi:uncharacterized protein (DUF3084 family)